MVMFIPKQKLYSSEYYKSGENIPISQDRQGSSVLDPNMPITFVPKRKFSTKKAGITLNQSTSNLGRGF
jgi:hypothetical protein